MTFALAFLFAAEPPAADDPAIVQVNLKPGERWEICSRRVMMCPAVLPICDNPKVAKGEFDDKLGLMWVGVEAGTTLCSAGSAGTKGALRRLFQVNVR